MTKEEAMWSVLNKKPITHEIETSEVLECMQLWGEEILSDVKEFLETASPYNEPYFFNLRLTNRITKNNKL